MLFLSALSWDSAPSLGNYLKLSNCSVFPPGGYHFKSLTPFLFKETAQNKAKAALGWSGCRLLAQSELCSLYLDCHLYLDYPRESEGCRQSVCSSVSHFKKSFPTLSFWWWWWWWGSHEESQKRNKPLIKSRKEMP